MAASYFIIFPALKEAVDKFSPRLTGIAFLQIYDVVAHAPYPHRRHRHKSSLYTGAKGRRSLPTKRNLKGLCVTSYLTI